MSWRVLCLFPLLAALTGPARGLDEVSSALERLGADDARERLEAQRWLGGHLTRGDFPAVAEALRAGSFEVRLRLTDALASDDRHLGLAALLATDPDARASAVGGEAIGEMIRRWNPAADEPPGRRQLLPTEWRRLPMPPLLIDPREDSLSGTLDRLARLGAGPAPIVLDPKLDPLVRRLLPGEREPASALAGTWAQIFTAIVSVKRVSFEVLGYDEGGLSRPWLRVCKRGNEDEGSTREHLVEWCRGVLAEANPNWNTACARALGTTGWPAGIRWMEERWRTDGDDASLEGLLAAAAHGRVTPGFANLAAVQTLLEGADARLVAKESGAVGHAERVARALLILGPTGAAGEPLADALATEWDTLESASRWMRLVAMEGQGKGHAACLAAATKELAGSAAPPLRNQALATLVKIRRGQDAAQEVGAAPELLAWAAGAGVLQELAGQLVSVRAEFPEGDWHTHLSRDTPMLLALFEWSAGTESAEALDLLEELAQRPDALDDVAARLRHWVGRGRSGQVHALVARATASASGDPLREAFVRRLALRADLLDEDAERALLDALLLLEAPNDDSLADLAELASAEVIGWRARAALVQELKGGYEPDRLRRGLERAFRGLRRRRQDEASLSFGTQLRRVARQAESPLLQELMRPDWPAEAPLSPRNLDTEDHRLGF